MRADVRWLPTHPPAATPEETYSKVPTHLAIAATLVSTALLIFSLRIYTRIRLLRFFGIDDCLMLVSVSP
ncbi:hypothetical protein K458DRAFT_384893 [Lentithecium fluviatile CBS 122367]|uniref:Integral membrane protein n=1 Tax=Lentithecium fluviatile CBS 122367 TaxID=1168545 RepID=A0A6G1JF20_9PLEO|nr:hypothetical protein K458DRAFT_384893 [Lentithecium fluviatile CBS 122367]